MSRLIQKLQRSAGLTGDEADGLAGAFVQTVEVQAGREIVGEGDRLRSCSVLEQGIACRQKVLSSGKRQILSLHFPGEILDVHALHIDVVDYAITAMTPCRITVASHAAMADLMRDHPPLARAMWREAMIDAAISLEWMTNLGRRLACTRTAHLLCEVYLRMESIGLARGNEIDWPFTQNDIADALGLSPVHVNRTLQALRGDGLITLSHKILRIRDFDALKNVADFDPTYLHLAKAVDASPRNEPASTIRPGLLNGDRHPDMPS